MYYAPTTDYMSATMNAVHSSIKDLIEGLTGSLREGAKILQGPIDTMALEQRLAMFGSVQMADQRETSLVSVLGSDGHYPGSPNGSDSSPSPSTPFNRGQRHLDIDSQRRGNYNPYTGPPPSDAFNRGKAYDPMIDSQKRGHHKRYNPNGNRAIHSRQVYAARAAKKQNRGPVSIRQDGLGRTRQIPRMRPSSVSV